MIWGQIEMVIVHIESRVELGCDMGQKCASGEPTDLARTSLPAALVRHFVYKRARICIQRYARQILRSLANILCAHVLL